MGPTTITRWHECCLGGCLLRVEGGEDEERAAWDTDEVVERLRRIQGGRKGLRKTRRGEKQFLMTEPLCAHLNYGGYERTGFPWDLTLGWRPASFPPAPRFPSVRTALFVDSCFSASLRSLLAFLPPHCFPASLPSPKPSHYIIPLPTCH